MAKAMAMDDEMDGWSVMGTERGEERVSLVVCEEEGMVVDEEEEEDVHEREVDAKEARSWACLD